MNRSDFSYPARSFKKNIIRKPKWDVLVLIFLCMLSISDSTARELTENNALPMM
uniref:Uncharacterized protein n=1 Tax=Setaria italica TaxID=4555 RepID=K4A448_SETIT